MSNKAVPLSQLGHLPKCKKAHTYGTKRRCSEGCGTILNRYQKGDTCAPCVKKRLDKTRAGIFAFKAFSHKASIAHKAS